MPVGKPKNLTGRGKTKMSPGPTQPYPKSTAKQVKPAAFNGVTVNVHGKKGKKS